MSHPPNLEQVGGRLCLCGKHFPQLMRYAQAIARLPANAFKREVAMASKYFVIVPLSIGLAVAYSVFSADSVILKTSIFELQTEKSK